MTAALQRFKNLMEASLLRMYFNDAIDAKTYDVAKASIFVADTDVRHGAYMYVDAKPVYKTAGQ